MVVKAPVATLLAVAGSLAIGIWYVRSRWRQWRDFAWPLACLLVPFALYMTSVMSSNLNIGQRHVLPVYSMIYVTAGALIALAWRRWGRPVAVGAATLGVMLMLESVLVWPNYIAYFNFAVGGSRGGLHLLADSNLDWCQDLPLIARWQREHPDAPPLALACFGDDIATEPAYWGIRFVPLESGVPKPDTLQNHIIAVSATHIQGVYRNPIQDFVWYQDKKPLEVLGGTIYLFDFRQLK
jgi:hypothetical protein